jgi:hypothetical protein
MPPVSGGGGEQHQNHRLHEQEQEGEAATWSPGDAPGRDKRTLGGVDTDGNRREDVYTSKDFGDNTLTSVTFSEPSIPLDLAEGETAFPYTSRPTTSHSTGLVPSRPQTSAAASSALQGELPSIYTLFKPNGIGEPPHSSRGGKRGAQTARASTSHTKKRPGGRQKRDRAGRPAYVLNVTPGSSRQHGRNGTIDGGKGFDRYIADHPLYQSARPAAALYSAAPSKQHRKSVRSRT